MDIIIIACVALIASGLTFFSGFGLGTILMPAFILFFPIDTAIALTAVVHLLNNILKLALLWKKAEWKVVLKFGIPAFFAAFVGAKVLFFLQGSAPLYIYEMFGREMIVTPMKLIIAIIMVIFVVLEASPSFNKINLPPKFLPFGGLLSGFFGGISGHQGALRSMFLLKCGLEKEMYIATGVVIACLVDFSRLFIYWDNLVTSQYEAYILPMTVAIIAAFAGVFLGRILLKKVTMKTVQLIISVMLLVMSLLLGLGVI